VTLLADPMSPVPHAESTRWYQDAIIYQLHVKTFCDGNGDGIGDFAGLISKLDYLQRLGVQCLWLLPFYASSLLDDGYDVSDYRQVHPWYGSLDDVRRFLDEAHRRGLRVINELIIDHTSDRHPWFEASRHAPAGSSALEFYVWSDTDQRFMEAHIIFNDTEPSNWARDPVAGAYYWHRFFRHQPDLNFDSPDVRAAVYDVVRFWFDLGVDGLRLDAVAHLYEREGTDCDNLPETHAFLRALRTLVDREYGDRVLLAEVNQTPEATCTYFGEGNECHMAFHFPLMPRLFQALATQQAEPIVDMVGRTSTIPAGCQWAIVLRNHDELTLSALSPWEREQLLDVYAPAPRMRLHHGIRRRLAPLLGNVRDRIELATALTFSLPGSPIVYYGDEIGMGDNIALPDRDGVRTPMQWSEAPQAGFTTSAVTALPVLEDGEYGYRRVNVANQDRDPRSLLHFVRRLMAARRSQPALGRGDIHICDVTDPRVLAFIRGRAADSVLVVANLAHTEVHAAVALPTGVPALNTTDSLRALPSTRRDGCVTLTLPGSAIGWWTAPS